MDKIEYKKTIIKMLNEIEDETLLSKIYKLVAYIYIYKSKE